MLGGQAGSAPPGDLFISSKSQRDRAHEPRLDKAVILIIDPDSVDSQVMHDKLSAAGYKNLTTASNASGALDRVKESQPDIVLLSVVATDPGGLDILRHIRVEQASAHTPVVVLLASQDTALNREALACGATSVMVGPFEADDMVLHVRNALVSKARFDHLTANAEKLKSEAQTNASQLKEVNEDLRRTNERLWTQVLESRKTAESLQHKASHDTLTNLGNRTLLMEQLTRCAERVGRDPDYIYAVIFIDLDNFKTINDSFGHDMGDQVLIDLADRIVACLRSLDTVVRYGNNFTARLGGDEFVILLEDLQTPKDTIVVAERLQQRISAPFQVGGQEIHASASIGIAIGDAQINVAQDLLRNADTAMYRAKMAGKARHALFDNAMHAAAVRRLEIESDLRVAVDEGQFELRYHPVVSLETSRVCVFESLIRWNHPTQGLLGPDDFIQVANETGMIIPIGFWAMTEACRQLKQWNDMLPHENAVSVSVNISQPQIAHADFLDSLMRVLHETGTSPHCLKLEITEATIMDNPGPIIEKLQQLRGLGIQFFMDDFGTGQSSLTCLHKFPIDYLKIDRAFVNAMGAVRDYAAVFHAITSLAHNLGVEVVAEGIETPDQLAQLIALECDYGQGYLFAELLDDAATKAFVTSLSPDGLCQRVDGGMSCA